jgi:hypothetical protein
VYAQQPAGAPLERELCELRPCQHTFHAACVLGWLPQASTCPACRVRVRGRWGPTSGLVAVTFSDAFAEAQLRAGVGGGRAAYDDTVCNVCQDGGAEHVMLLCDGCDRGFHTHCVQLPRVPRGAWHCRRCRRAAAVEDGADDDAPPAPCLWL